MNKFILKLINLKNLRHYIFTIIKELIKNKKKQSMQLKPCIGFRDLKFL